MGATAGDVPKTRLHPSAAAAVDRHLHARLLSHDPLALGEVYDRFGPLVFDAALKVTADHHAALDVTQETMLELWRRPELFCPERGGLRPWLTTIAHNRAIDWIRREQAARRRDRRDALVVAQVPDIADDVQAVMSAERVRCAILALPEPERTPIQLAYFGGRTYRQVAESLDLAEGTVKARIRAGLRHLSQTMRGELLPTG
jgi:RNA polymerase sigma factor (sigma-70 family)